MPPEPALVRPELVVVVAAVDTTGKEDLAWAAGMAAAAAAGDGLELARAARALLARSIQCALHTDATRCGGPTRRATRIATSRIDLLPGSLEVIMRVHKAFMIS